MKKRTLITVTLFLVFCQSAFGQFNKPGRNRHPGFDKFGTSLFSYQVYNFADDANMDKSKAIFYFSLVNDILTFIKQTDKTYIANYDINVILYDQNEQAIAEQFIKDQVIVDDFKKTNSRTNVINQKLEFSLEPGKYEYRIRLGNGETETYLVRKNDIVLKNYQNNKMHTSDLIFVDEINCQNPHPNSLKPNLKNTFDKLESDFAAYFEIYSGQKTGTITIDYKVQDSQSKIKNTDRLTYTLPTEKIPVCLTFKDHIEKPGEYLLTILVRGDQNIEKIKKKFGVNWTKIGIRTDNIDVAIEQLELIAKDDIIDKMKSAPEPKKNALFDEFWQKRDPSPDTPVNELKIEFFRRVDFANKNFTQVSPNRPGWKTDRGRIYIKNGPPSEVEKHPTELNMPTAEIWYYARLNKRYIFTDRHGTGDYRLIRVE